jgi:hypothetical protein
MPFYAFDIMRGQSRGANKSSWFGSSNVDESGQASTLTKAGYFKGTIDVTNLADHAEYTKQQAAATDRIIDLLNKISKAKEESEGKKNQPFQFKLNMLEHLQTKNVFANVLDNILGKDDKDNLQEGSAEYKRSVEEYQKRKAHFATLVEFLTEIQVEEAIKE